MRRLPWTKTLRTTLLVAGFSLATSAVLGSSMLQSTLVAAEDSAKEAATVEDAAKVLDLSTLPLAEGAKVPFGRHLGLVTYEVDGDLKSAFQFHQKQLTKLGWKELPGTTSQAEYISAAFQKSGFIVSVGSYAGSDPTKPKSATVSLSNLGNVRLSKLPAVKGAKQVFANDVTATYSTTLKPADAATATRKLLMDAGWEPYGTASNPPDSEVMTFKRNAVRLIAFVGVSPVQKDQVMISYNSTLMAADIPAPTNAKEVAFDDAQKTLQFQSTESFDDVAKFYQQRLAKMGWTPTSKELSKTKYGDDRPLGELGFKNTSKDSLALRLTEEDGKTQVRLTLRTAADIAALQKELKAAEEKFAAEDKARKEAAEAEAKATASTKPAAKKGAAKSDDGIPDVDALVKDAIGDALKEAGLGGKKPAKGAAKANAGDKDAVSVPIPEGAKKVTQTSGNVLQIKWPANKGKPSAEALRDQLLAAGWEVEDDSKIEKNSGNVTFTKDGKTLTMSFVDTGLTDVNMMLIGIGLKLSEGKADPDAKVPTASATPKSKPKSDPSDDDPIKALKKKAGRKPSKSDGDDKPAVSLPPRVEKPIRGIAKLDKLPTEVKLVADGKPVSLPHVIAYEIVDNGRWVTRVLATETPIKQSSLIDLLRKGGPDDELRSKSPRVLVELDDQDKLDNMSYAGNGSLGSGRDVTGEAIVEAGRARGTFKANKESEFFGKKIIGEITFDVPVLTRDSQPEKRLANAKKLETSGNLVVNNKTMKLANFVAYQAKWNDEVRTTILFSEKPINVAKLKASLAKNGNDDGNFDFASQVKVTIDKDDNPAFLNLYADGASINQNTGLVGDVIVEDGRARGTVKLDKAIDFAGKSINFDLTFDVEVLMLPKPTKE